MKRATQLEITYPMPLYFFCSSVYWPTEAKRLDLFHRVADAVGVQDVSQWKLTFIDDEETATVEANRPGDTPCVFVALSGGVQSWMQMVGADRTHLGLFNAYLPEALPSDVAHLLMHANAHPASTDFFASCRMAGKSIEWFDSLAQVRQYAVAWQGTCRLKNARFLKIGETEPWVINSCRSPEMIAERIGCEIVPIERVDLYTIYETISDAEALEVADQWLQRNGGLEGIVDEDVIKASRVTAAMYKALENHDADGLSMACFAMITDIDTTSCLALSALNDSASFIGACEGDLDSALTLFLLKAMGADFVWIANPIIHSDNTLDLVHCTAPTCACGSQLPFRLMRHHESGRGVSPEVVLPGGVSASAVRLSVNAGEIVCHVGLTERKSKLPACHTQIRLHVESSQAVIDTLLGTHLVLSYGDFEKPLSYASKFLGLKSVSTSLSN
jgi:hypothetical protein